MEHVWGRDSRKTSKEMLCVSFCVCVFETGQIVFIAHHKFSWLLPETILVAFKHSHVCVCTCLPAYACV